jgi:hypothetical protein
MTLSAANLILAEAAARAVCAVGFAAAAAAAGPD